MISKTIKLLCVFMCIEVSCPVLWAYTPAETNQVVVAMLNKLKDYGSQDYFPQGRNRDGEDRPDTWEKLCQGTVADGWSSEDRKMAFMGYLQSLGTADLKNSLPRDRVYVRLAISQCRLLNDTNVVESLIRLSQNPNGIFRDYSAEVAISIGGIDERMTTFVENIVTNRASTTSLERSVALCEFGKKLRCGGVGQELSKRHAVEMVYRNRMSEVGAVVGCDMVLTNCIEHYGMSSNRLEAMLWALKTPASITDAYRDYLIGVTNQLLSSDQQLRQLTINEGGNE